MLLSEGSHTNFACYLATQNLLCGLLFSFPLKLQLLTRSAFSAAFSFFFFHFICSYTYKHHLDINSVQVHLSISWSLSWPYTCISPSPAGWLTPLGGSMCTEESIFPKLNSLPTRFIHPVSTASPVFAVLLNDMMGKLGFSQSRHFYFVNTLTLYHLL